MSGGTIVSTLGWGLLATLLALLQAAGWAGLLRRPALKLGRPELALPAALVGGAAVTGFAYAVLTGTGHVTSALVAGGVLSVAGLVLGGRWAVATALELLRGVADALGYRLLRVLAAAVALGAWLLAITPPRDSDVLRYHLAHVRQIIQDGGWQALPDYHYALPFGWSLGFLPFEQAGLPVTAQLLNLVLAAVLVGSLCALARRFAPPGAGVALVALLVVLQPMLLKMATTAHADVHIILVATVLLGLLLEPAGAGRAWAAWLGFIALVGLQSRYQAAALAIAAGAVLAWRLVRRTIGTGLLVPLAGGAIGAAVLASPFYLVNFNAFRNPFWPLLSGSIGDTTSYASLVAHGYDEGLNGTLSAATLRHALRALVTDTLVFPVPIAAIAVLAALVALPRVRRQTGGILAFLVAFVIVWAVTQPNLYPRFVLLLVPALVLGGAAAVASLTRRIPRAALVATALAALLPFAAFDAWYARDAARFIVTGNRTAYDRYTWYADVTRWVNGAAPAGARGLVILQSDQTYWLDRPYRRADPFLTGQVDWRAVRTGPQLAAVLRRGGYDFVILDTTDWSGYLGGREMTAAIRSAAADGTLVPLRRFKVELSTSRIRRTQMQTTVIVYGVAGSRWAGPASAA